MFSTLFHGGKSMVQQECFLHITESHKSTGIKTSHISAERYTDSRL